MRTLEENKKNALQIYKEKKNAYLLAGYDAGELESVLRCEDRMHETRSYYISRNAPTFGASGQDGNLSDDDGKPHE